MKRLVCLCLCVATACVGPARTEDVYEGKAVETAKAVRSAVSTAQLAAVAAARKNATGQYLSIVLADSEEAAGGAASAFDSIQPPNGRSEELHEALAEIIDQALEVLREMRIAARRTERAALGPRADDLVRIGERLEAFVEAHE